MIEDASPERRRCARWHGRFVSSDAMGPPSAPDHRGMIEFVIIMLVVVGVFSALAGLVGRDMRKDVRKRDELSDLFMGPRASSR